MFEGGIQDNMSTSKEVSLQSFCEGAVKAFSFQVSLSTLHTDNTQDCHCFTHNIDYMVLLHILLCLALASFPGSPPHRMMSASNFSLLHKGREPGNQATLTLHTTFQCDNFQDSISAMGVWEWDWVVLLYSKMIEWAVLSHLLWLAPFPDLAVESLGMRLYCNIMCRYSILLVPYRTNPIPICCSSMDQRQGTVCSWRR